MVASSLYFLLTRGLYFTLRFCGGLASLALLYLADSSGTSYYEKMFSVQCLFPDLANLIGQPMPLKITHTNRSQQQFPKIHPLSPLVASV